MSARLSTESLDRIEQAKGRVRVEALATAQRPLLTVPASWWDVHVAEAMAVWIRQEALAAEAVAS